MMPLPMRDGRTDQWRARLLKRTRARRLGAVAALVGLAGILQLEPARAVTASEPAKVTREAYFTHPITQATPPLLRNGFPPATACLVAGLVGVPQVCGTEVQQVAALLGLSDGLPVPITPDGDLAQPIALPGTTPVGMLAGQQRYVSLLALGLPALPEGERFGSFELVLHQEGFNFAIESPALRDLVLQIVAQLEDQDPQKIADSLTKALSGEIPLATQTITGIEACPAVQGWTAGRAQGAALDGTRLPDVDCQIGTTGTFDAATGTWTFDLTFAVQAWTQGRDGGEPLENQGIVLRPVGAPNLAYGDPDLSTNWVVSLADSTAGNAGLRPEVRYTTVSDDDGLVVDDGGSFDDLPLPSDDGGGFDLGPLPSDTGDTGGGDGGQVAAPVTPTAAREDPYTPGWVWIALPLGLVGAYVFDQSLGATPAATRRRPGALSRLEADKP